MEAVGAGNVEWARAARAAFEVFFFASHAAGDRAERERSADAALGELGFAFFAVGFEYEGGGVGRDAVGAVVVQLGNALANAVLI